MAVTEAFLTTCRTSIERASELSAFRTAYAAYNSASRSTRGVYRELAYGSTSGESLAYKCRAMIRSVVTNLSTTNGVTAIDREDAIRTLAAEYVPDAPRIIPPAEEAAEFRTLIDQELAL